MPQSALDGLTSEDFRLLLNGVGEIDVRQLMSYTTFNDETGKSKLLDLFEISWYLTHCLLLFISQEMEANICPALKSGSGLSLRK